MLVLPVLLVLLTLAHSVVVWMAVVQMVVVVEVTIRMLPPWAQAVSMI